jgi:hypothetical protein
MLKKSTGRRHFKATKLRRLQVLVIPQNTQIFEIRATAQKNPPFVFMFPLSLSIFHEKGSALFALSDLWEGNPKIPDPLLVAKFMLL